MRDYGDDLSTLTGARADNEPRRVIKEVTFAAPARATLATALTGNNNDLDFSAVQYGEAGNAITVAYVDPGLPSQSIGVTVTGTAIVVALATGAGTNEAQTITLLATGGNFTVTFKDKSSARIPYGASGAAMQTALEQIPTIGVGNVSVSKASDVYTVTFQGALAATNVPQMTVDGNSLLPVVPTISVATTVPGDGTHNEVQTVTLNNARDGVFKITYSGQTTSLLNYGASATTVQTAMRALSNINGANINVTKSSDVYTLTFVGTLALTNVAQVTASSGLRGVYSATVATTIPGVAPAITSTAANVATAISASDPADALVATANHSGNDGTGVVTALAATHLTGGTQGYGTRAAQATLTTSLTGTNNDLVFTAVPTGNAGNGITVAYIDPGGTTATLSVGVDVQKRYIQVNLGRAASAINSTAAGVATAIAASVDASALVTTANAGGNDGTGLVTAMSVASLTGGASNVSLFTVSGEVDAAVILVPTVSLAGSSATLKVGTATVTAGLIPVTTATNVTKGVVVDKTGVVASGTAPFITPHAPLADGDTVSLTPATADITAGHILAACYYVPLSDGARVLPV